jgi:hypothetical protein
MTNPYESPKAVSRSERAPREEGPTEASNADLHVFFARYFGAFIAAQLLWHLSAFVRAFDLLEIPMATPLFPLASFLDPYDSMVNQHSAVFFCGLLFWGALIPVSLRLAGKRLNPLIPAMAILLLTSLASVGYVLLVGFRTGPVP